MNVQGYSTEFLGQIHIVNKTGTHTLQEERLEGLGRGIGVGEWSDSSHFTSLC